jgi:hypothetical protein
MQPRRQQGVDGASATSPAAGGVRGVSPRQPDHSARFRCRRALLRCARFARAPTSPRILPASAAEGPSFAAHAPSPAPSRRGRAASSRSLRSRPRAPPPHLLAARQVLHDREHVVAQPDAAQLALLPGLARPLARAEDDAQRDDVADVVELARLRLEPQRVQPFRPPVHLERHVLRPQHLVRAERELHDLLRALQRPRVLGLALQQLPAQLLVLGGVQVPGGGGVGGWGGKGGGG